MPTDDGPTQVKNVQVKKKKKQSMILIHNFRSAWPTKVLIK